MEGEGESWGCISVSEGDGIVPRAGGLEPPDCTLGVCVFFTFLNTFSPFGASSRRPAPSCPSATLFFANTKVYYPLIKPPLFALARGPVI